MERPVMRRRRARLPAGIFDSANEIRDDRRTGRPESVPVPVELGLEKLAVARRFDRCRRDRRRRHAGACGPRERAWSAGKRQHHRKGEASRECPEDTASQAHQSELNSYLGRWSPSQGAELLTNPASAISVVSLRSNPERGIRPKVA